MAPQVSPPLVPVASPAKRPPPEASPPEFDDLAVRQVRLGGWRVTDLLVDVDDPARLLGFVESTGDRFEVMKIGTEFSWVMFDTMDEALEHLRTQGRAAAHDRNSGRMSWLAGLARSPFDAL